MPEVTTTSTAGGSTRSLPSEGPGERERRETTAPLPLWAALLVALASAPVLDAAFPDRDWWPLVFPGVALTLVPLIGRRLGSAFLVGFVAGFAFFGLHTHWTTMFLGLAPWSTTGLALLPWVGLTTLMALWCGLGGMLITLAYRWLPHALPGILGRMLALPAVVAALWIAREGISGTWPYGGFAWGRVALSQSESPLAQLFPWLGVAGVSFAIVFVSAVGVEAVRATAVPRIPRLVLPLGLLAMLLIVPGFPIATTGEVRVLAVQGNANAGYFQPSEWGDNLADQVSATLDALSELDEPVDLVVWPEGGSELDPLRSDEAARVWDAISRAADAPLVAGTFTNRGDDYFNTVLSWSAGEGAVDMYDKKHPVPFGEYVPQRALFERIVPDLIGLIGREYTPGSLSGALSVGGPGTSQSILAGVAICFDIVNDRLVADLVRDGAEIILAPTNNADFGPTDQSIQQLAIARIRALELGRSVVNISTVGTSAIIAPDGSTVEQLPTFEPGWMAETVPTSDTVTPAARAGSGIEIALVALGVLGLGASGVYAVFLPRRERR